MKVGKFRSIGGEARRRPPYNYGFNNPIRFVDPDGMLPQGPGIGVNPFRVVAEGFRQMFQAAGNQVDKVSVSVSATLSSITGKVKTFFGSVTNSVDATYTATAGTNFGGYLNNYGNNTPSEPLFKPVFKKTTANKTKVEATVSVEGVDVKTTNTTSVDTSTGEVSNTTEVVVGKRGNGAFVSHTKSSTGSSTEVGVKASVTTPEVANTTFTISAKAAVTIQKDEKK